MMRLIGQAEIEDVDVEAIGDEPCGGSPAQNESGPIGKGGGADDVVGPLPLAEELLHRIRRSRVAG